MDIFKWGTVMMLEDGHRLFPTGDPTKIAIADNSGREPQDCDDGILWLDFDWNLIISSPDGVICIPVKRSDGERFSTITDVSTLLQLSAMYGWPIEDQNPVGENVLYSVTRKS